MIAVRQKVADRPQAQGKQLRIFEEDVELNSSMIMGPDRMNQTDLDGTEAALLLMTVAYNFPSLFKRLIIGGNIRNRLKTLRHRRLAIPAIIEKCDGKITVKMALRDAK
ncbi:MAG: hypothetical protein LBK96_06280 [Prevotellaceae bacterium]|jgi:hypothetical protein|nr:hypothetical protein [Prevotellaceae bacterium]